jgi:hypothetical protein
MQFTKKGGKAMALMIGRPTQTKILEMIGALINDHLDQINNAYTKAEDGMNISFSVKVKPGNGANELDVGISFVESRCKDNIKDAVDEHQLMMWGTGGAKQ